MEPLHKDIICLIVELIKDSRAFGITCRHVYRIYQTTLDYRVFTWWDVGATAKITPPKLYKMFTAAEFYDAGNLPCLIEKWRRGYRNKTKFINSMFEDPISRKGKIKNGAAIADWLMSTFASVLMDSGGYCEQFASIAMCGHSELLKKVLNKNNLGSVDFDLFDIIADLTTYILLYENMSDDGRVVVRKKINKRTPTAVVAYISIRGDPVIGCNIEMFANNLGHLRAARLDDVIEYYGELLGESNLEVARWLKSLE